MVWHHDLFPASLKLAIVLNFACFNSLTGTKCICQDISVGFNECLKYQFLIKFIQNTLFFGVWDIFMLPNAYTCSPDNLTEYQLQKYQTTPMYQWLT